MSAFRSLSYLMLTRRWCPSLPRMDFEMFHPRFESQLCSLSCSLIAWSFIISNSFPLKDLTDLWAVNRDLRWTAKMAGWVKALVSKPGDPSLIPRNHMVERGNQLLKVDLNTCAMAMHTHLYIHAQTHRRTDTGIHTHTENRMKDMTRENHFLQQLWCNGHSVIIAPKLTWKLLTKASFSFPTIFSDRDPPEENQVRPFL